MPTEEQTQSDASASLYLGYVEQEGQQLTISGREVTKLAFLLKKVGSPTGDITFTIRKVSDDAIILSRVWGDASALQGGATWEEVEFVTPETINEDVRILCEYSGGNSNNKVGLDIQAGDVKADEMRTFYFEGSWGDTAVHDDAYIYTYSEESAAAPSPSSSLALMNAGVI